MSQRVSPFRRKHFGAHAFQRGGQFQLPSSDRRKRFLAVRNRRKLRGEGFLDGIRGVARTLCGPRPPRLASLPRVAGPSMQDLFNMEGKSRRQQQEEEELAQTELEMEVELAMRADRAGPEAAEEQALMELIEAQMRYDAASGESQLPSLSDSEIEDE